MNDDTLTQGISQPEIDRNIQFWGDLVNKYHQQIDYKTSDKPL